MKELQPLIQGGEAAEEEFETGIPLFNHTVDTLNILSPQGEWLYSQLGRGVKNIFASPVSLGLLREEFVIKGTNSFVLGKIPWCIEKQTISHKSCLPHKMTEKCKNKKSSATALLNRSLSVQYSYT